MKMKRSLLLFAIINLKFAYGSYVKFLEDFVDHQGKFSAVTEFSCNKYESVQLFKKLSARHHKFSFLKSDESVSSLKHPLHSNVQFFVMSLHCPQASHVIVQADIKQFFKFPFHWIVTFNSSIIPVNEANDFFGNVNILADSDVNLAEFREQRDEVFVRKIFKKFSGSNIVIENMGIWSKDEHFKIFENFEKVVTKRRKNLSGTTLNACLVITHNDSLNHLTDKKYKHIDSVTKVNYVLIRELKDIFNISFNYSIESTWGYMDNKSQWNGMIGQLIRKEADFGGTPLFVTKPRVDLIDYIAMTTPTRSKFVFRSPKLSYVSNVYTLPFDNKVWISTIFLGIVSSIFLLFILKWEWKKKEFAEINDTSNSSELKDSIFDVSLLTLTALCQQGASALPLSIPGRIAAIFLYLSLMFLYTSYSANIVALLQSSSNNIKTLEDLLNSRIQIGVDDTVFNHFFFPNSEDPVRKALYHQKIAPPGKKDSFMAIDQGVAKMRQGLFAFHMELGAGYKIVSETFREEEKCGLQEIRFLQVTDPWVAIQKNSTYKEMFKIGLRLIHESGLQARENSLIYTKKPVCTAKSSTFITVGLVDCYPAAILLAAGIVLAFGLLLLEIYAHSRLKSYKKRFTRRFEMDPKTFKMEMIKPRYPTYF